MSFTNKEGKLIVLNIIDTIQKHKDYLSEIDGAIGDGDHGINMNKGVTIAKSQVDKNETLSEALWASLRFNFYGNAGRIGKCRIH